MLAEPKDFKTYEEQVDLLSARGMRIGDRHKAVERLRGGELLSPLRLLVPVSKIEDRRLWSD